MHLSDAELIQKVKNKDKQAFVELFDRYKDKIFRYVYGYIKDYDKAKDLTMDTFMSAYSHIDRYKGIGKFSSWLYAIATNYAKRHLENRKRLREVSLDAAVDHEGMATLADFIADDSGGPDHDARVAELKELVYDVLSRMDEKYRRILMLCEIDGLSYIEAARVLKTNPITVGTRVRRARQKFYEHLKKYKDEL